MFRFITADKLPENVILTDDPMRVEMLAAHYINDARLVSEIRGMKGYAGIYHNVPVATISCGFGKTATEMFIREAYSLGARCLIYIGQCISVVEEYSLMDIIIYKKYEGRLTKNLITTAKRKKTVLRFDDVYTNDRFWLGEVNENGHKIVDFASEGVYEAAKSLSMEALAILVVSDNTLKNEKIEESVRQSGLHIASQLAFEALTQQTTNAPRIKTNK